MTFTSNTTFITFRGLFLGALFTQLEEAYSSGHFDFSPKTLGHMAVGSAIAAGFSLWHLYLPQPAKPSQTGEQQK
jgi:hypothetical protein